MKKNLSKVINNIKNIRLIKILLKDKWYRTKWCKKHSIETLTDEELEKDLKRHQEEKMILERFIER